MKEKQERFAGQMATGWKNDSTVTLGLSWWPARDGTNLAEEELQQGERDISTDA